MTTQEFKKSTVSNLPEILEIIESGKLDCLNYHWLKSNVPKKCTSEPCVLGVDEAGRGPVLGPMVYSVFYCPANEVEILKEIGCTDSKALTEKKRENIFELINSHNDKVGWIVDAISPNLISNRMLKRAKFSLNEIAQQSTISLINHILDEKVNVKEIYVDTIGPADKYQEKLSKLFPDCKITVEKKADSLYPVVGAASICAKVIRDNIVQHWKYGELLNITETDVGTGYPGDPKSKKFLLDVKDDIFGFPNLVRFSWSTAAKLLEKNTAVEWEDESENFHNSEKPNISSYFKPLMAVAKHKTVSTYLKERCLSNVDSF
ncbi:hypothetical protein RUM44_000475 [Polyplax serrata]|uniref:Ribonuclease n=1 Tax=Polyplax serrata TaxID=468196 RepID=A0ABR1B5K8_POLSC